jgi:uracil-DNA glycosylase family 4
MSTARDLAAHLRYLKDLGVDGLSSDPSWRVRASAPDALNAPDRPAQPIQPAQPDQPDQPAQADQAGRLLTLTEIRTDLGDCRRCKLHAGRTNIVFGVGDPAARLMFVGEGPGADEDEKGEPFVGRAGQLLTQIIKAMGLEREQVYIANVVKCRPPGNRNPEPDEIEACSPFLHAQIASIGPAVIVALGKFAAQTLLQTETPISRLRGQFHSLNGVAVMPTFHPSYLLRNPAAKREEWADMKMVIKKLQIAD